MNDIRRTILWVIFGFSMVLLWDQWQVYTGHPATFFPQATKQTANAPARAGSSSVPPASGTATPAAATTGTAAVPSTAASAPAATSQKITVETDVMRLVFDTEGGTLIRTEFLKE